MNVPGFTAEFSLNGCNQYNIMYSLDNNNEYVIPVNHVLATTATVALPIVRVDVIKSVL